MQETPARVLLEIENRAVADGRPLYLVRDEATGKYALARMVAGSSELMALESKWVEVATAIRIAYRVAGGDNLALTHPGVVQAFAIVLLAADAAALELAQAQHAAAVKEAGIERPAEVVHTRKQEALTRGYTGDICIQCSNFTMKRNGTCLVCETCGANTGCS